jgi:DNA polymerase-3 subunit epsilon
LSSTDGRRGDRWADLFDEREARKKRPMSEAQHAALAKARHAAFHCKDCGFALYRGYCANCADRDRRKLMVECAREWLEQGVLILDTETTGLDGYLVALAIIDTNGDTLFESLVNPECPIEDGAQQVHGLSNEDVATAPTWREICEQVGAILNGRYVITYNDRLRWCVYHAPSEFARRVVWYLLPVLH